MPAPTRRDVLAAGAAGLAFVAGCTGSNRNLPERPTGRWRHRAHDARNSGSSRALVPPRGTPAWDAGEAHMAAPLVAGGVVYSVSREVTALDAKNGDVRWSYDLKGKADHTPALIDDVLVVAADDQVVALATGDGEEVWSTSLTEIVTGAVTASSDQSLVVVPVGDSHLQALDPTNGDRQWRDSIVASRQAAIADGTVYATGYRADGDTGVLRAVSGADGTSLWDADLTHPDAAPVFAEEGLVVADEGTLAVHEPADGERRYVLGDFGDRVAVPPAVADGTAYAASGNGGLAAVSMGDGTVEWRSDVRVTVDTGISVGADAVVVPVSDLPVADLPGVVAFERTDGSHRWERPIEGFDSSVSTPVALADGAIFYSSNESVGVVALGDLPLETE